jgi:hypothetical protein
MEAVQTTTEYELERGKPMPSLAGRHAQSPCRRQGHRSPTGITVTIDEIFGRAA